MAEKLKTETEAYTLEYCSDCNNAKLGKMKIDDNTKNVPDRFSKIGVLETYYFGETNNGLSNTKFQIIMSGYVYGTIINGDSTNIVYVRSSGGASSWSEWIKQS